MDNGISSPKVAEFGSLLVSAFLISKINFGHSGFNILRLLKSVIRDL